MAGHGTTRLTTTSRVSPVLKRQPSRLIAACGQTPIVRSRRGITDWDNQHPPFAPLSQPANLVVTGSIHLQTYDIIPAASTSTTRTVVGHAALTTESLAESVKAETTLPDLNLTLVVQKK